MSDNDKEIKVTPYSNGKGAKIDVYSPSSRVVPHDTAHIKVSDGKKVEIVTKVDGKKESTSGQCYLTSACMKHFQDEFDDNCYELTVLRWFRDNFVSKEDIELYYNVAPIIVKNIDALEDNEQIYNYIYSHIVEACVKAIENGDYDFAYNRYKSSVLALNEQFGEKEKEQETGFVKKIGALHNKPALA